jgi:hypothetical protein
MFLIERLESQVATGTGLPRTSKALVDREAILELVDQLRAAVPEEVQAAKRINSEGERIIEKAEDEAARITARAQEQAAYLIGERGLTEAAQAEGRRIIAEAQDAAADVRLGADAYAAEILEGLEAEVRKALAGIEKGIDVLEVRQAELRGTGSSPESPADGQDLESWPDVQEAAVAAGTSGNLREEDAGQIVPR